MKPGQYYHLQCFCLETSFNSLGKVSIEHNSIYLIQRLLAIKPLNLLAQFNSFKAPNINKHCMHLVCILQTVNHCKGSKFLKKKLKNGNNHLKVKIYELFVPLYFAKNEIYSFVFVFSYLYKF